MDSAPKNQRHPEGICFNAKAGTQEAAMRMLMNNLDQEVAERRMNLLCTAQRQSRAQTGNAIQQ